MSNAGSRVGVVLEVVPRRSFASALDWRGWCRSESTPDAAREALAADADRYATVAAVAGMRRRLAWHALDHAWEMQDRGTP